MNLLGTQRNIYLTKGVSSMTKLSEQEIKDKIGKIFGWDYIKTFEKSNPEHFNQVKGMIDELSTLYIQLLKEELTNYVSKKDVEGLKLEYRIIDSRAMDNVEMHDKSVQNLVISEINSKIDTLTQPNGKEKAE